MSDEKKLPVPFLPDAAVVTGEFIGKGDAKELESVVEGLLDRILFLGGISLGARVPHNMSLHDILRAADNLKRGVRDSYIVGIDTAADGDQSITYMQHDGDIFIIDDLEPLKLHEIYEAPLEGKAKHTAELNKMRAKFRGKRRW